MFIFMLFLVVLPEFYGKNIKKLSFLVIKCTDTAFAILFLLQLSFIWSISV